MNLRQNILQFLGDGQAQVGGVFQKRHTLVGKVEKITAVRRTLPEPMTCASRMFAAPTRMKSSTFRQMPRKPTSLDSALSLTAHMTPVM